MSIDYSKFLNNTKSNTSKIDYSKLGYTPKTIDYSKFTNSTSFNTENLKNIPTVDVNTQTANSTPSIVRNSVLEAPLTKEATSDKSSPLVSKYGFKGKSENEVATELAKKQLTRLNSILPVYIPPTDENIKILSEDIKQQNKEGAGMTLARTITNFALPTSTVVPGEGAMLSKAGESLSEKKPIIEEIPSTNNHLKSSVEPQIAPETPINTKPQNIPTEPIKPVEPTTESVTNKPLFNGSNKVVKEENKTFNNVLTFDNSQRDVISQLAQNGNKEAQAIIDNPTNFYHEADNLIRKEYGSQYDAIQYKNLDRPQIGNEYHDLKTDTHWAENKDYAESYALQNRGLGVKTVTKPEELTYEPVAGADKITKVSNDINTKLVKAGFDQLPEEELARFNTITKKDQIEKVTNLLDNYPDQAKQMASGDISIPSDIHPQVLFNAVATKAQKTGDYETLIKLAKSPIAEQRSIAAQTLGASGFNEEGVMESINQVFKNKIANVEKTTGKKITKLAGEELNKIKTEINKVKPTKDIWLDFVKEIEC